MKNKIVFWLLIVFSFANILDVVTAMFILPGESNPIYLLFQSATILILFKTFLVVFAWYIYSKNIYPSKWWYFTAIYILVGGSVLYFLGAASNIYGMINPVIIQNASQITTTAKIGYYSEFVLLLAIIPYILSIITFKLYDLSIKHIILKRK